MEAGPYQMCTRCIMDTSDPGIVFDEAGRCSHCRDYELVAQTQAPPPGQRQAALERLVGEIKATGHNRDYDCIIGVSGGVDSTYVAYLVKQMGLRPLAVHMDNGWDSELAVSNIEKVLKQLDIDLFTHVLDWEEFKDLQISFLKASVSDAEIPTDHAIHAVLYQQAARRNIKYVLFGTNHVTEAILPVSWTFGIQDWRYINGVHRRFGSKSLKTFPHLGYWTLNYYYRQVKRIRQISVLDYIDYNKVEAIRVLTDVLGWRPYGGKHYESIYTRFFQGYILPAKFGIDKRRAHLSTLIMSGQITRDAALAEVRQPPYAGYMQEEDMDYVLKKLGFSEEEFRQIMALPIRTYHDYPNSLPLVKLTRTLNLGRWARFVGIKPFAA